MNIYKEADYTSSDVVQVVKKITKSKAGHTGTLDPMATGVLPICLGKATKIADYIMGGDKEYIAQVILGEATDTCDAYGAIIGAAKMSPVRDEILAVLPQFSGEISQIPPMYSALKVGGKRLHDLARQGITIERNARQITIHSLEVLKWDLPSSFVIKVKCSKGTYIRTLCDDIGRALGGYAHMGKLLRTTSSNFTLETALTLDKLAKGDLDKIVMPIEKALSGFPKVYIKESGAKLLANGNKLPLEHARYADNLQKDTLYTTFTHDGNLAGIFRAESEILRPVTMLLDLHGN
ncbi:MAG: tRNA pseudouridine(55) synthase TruB [Defluviitaleaceae bacterium]|nr:tRNA pseudouridine(55) synthase TruB [Defluviitaleaceae bacterium]